MSDAANGDVKEQECSDCGKLVVKIWRIYKNYRYCSTCYARVFKHQVCPRCRNIQRLPKNIPNAVCRTCETSKPCTRCGKTDYAIGKITPYGVVCKACLPYFQELKTCGLCGKLSRCLTRVKRLNIEVPVCSRCARQDHKTCQACHRYRLLAKAPDGRMVCKPCLKNGSVPCPKCSEAMPAGYGQQCEKCYWKALLEKRINIDCAAFSSSPMASHFKAFGQWLCGKVGENKAASTIHRYLPFFVEIEQQWEVIPEYKRLLGYFGAARLRKAILPVQWMEELQFIVSDALAKDDDSNKRRIKAILGKFTKGSQEEIWVTSYYNSLIEDLKANKTTIRSVRLALSPAAALLVKAKEMQCMPPSQPVLDAFLDEKPGQRAALSGFICTLRNDYGVPIVLPKSSTGKARRNRKKKLEAVMLALMQENGKTDKFKQKWLSVSLAYFHDLPKNVGSRLKTEDIVDQGDGGITVIWGGQKYWVPEAIKND